MRKEGMTVSGAAEALYKPYSTVRDWLFLGSFGSRFPRMENPWHGVACHDYVHWTSNLVPCAGRRVLCPRILPSLEGLRCRC